ncbi:unnamed protein product [Cylicocyclus nassatus]|uniref:Uncharacterized protein n=1 Tax=Cylicocyclus nassatus TaxID=53992 RepID=A0AA36H792_CYLNA|nr:unnamed protein product [Cylicocyclus nassatus]
MSQNATEWILDVRCNFLFAKKISIWIKTIAAEGLMELASESLHMFIVVDHLVTYI